MTNSDLISKFDGRKQRAAGDIPRLIEEISYHRRRIRLAVVLSNLSLRHLDLGMHAYFVMGDMAMLRQHFHVASKLRVASINEDGRATFELDIPFLFAMLSDSPEVINSLSTLEPSKYVHERDDPRRPQYYVHMLQLALRDDHTLLREKIALAARKAGKSYREEFAAGQDLYSLLLARDKAGLEARLNRRARIKSVNPWIEDFIAGAAMVEAKLCWLKGIPVQIDNPLIPMALLPVQPLAHYGDVYEFLQPGWKPPLQGALGKLISRLKSRK